MNFFDIIVIVLLLWSAFKGFTKGFIVSLASLVALFAGVFGAIKFSSFTASFLADKNILQEKSADLIAFSVTFLIIVVAIFLLARILTKIVEAAELGIFNRIAGVLFSIFKTAFIISIVLVVFNSVNDNVKLVPEEKINNSIFFTPLSRLAPAVFPYLDFKKGSNKPKNISPNEVIT